MTHAKQPVMRNGAKLTMFKTNFRTVSSWAEIDAKALIEVKELAFF